MTGGGFRLSVVRLAALVLALRVRRFLRRIDRQTRWRSGGRCGAVAASADRLGFGLPRAGWRRSLWFVALFGGIGAPALFGVRMTGEPDTNRCRPGASCFGVVNRRGFVGFVLVGALRGYRNPNC